MRGSAAAASGSHTTTCSLGAEHGLLRLESYEGAPGRPVSGNTRERRLPDCSYETNERPRRSWLPAGDESREGDCLGASPEGRGVTLWPEEEGGQDEEREEGGPGSALRL